MLTVHAKRQLSASRSATLAPVSHHNLTLVPRGWRQSADAIAQAEKSGQVTAVPLGKLPLDRHYTVGHLSDTTMAHRSPAGFQWNQEDRTTTGWLPQAITTSSD